MFALTPALSPVPV